MPDQQTPSLKACPFCRDPMMWLEDAPGFTHTRASTDRPEEERCFLRHAIFHAEQLAAWNQRAAPPLPPVAEMVAEDIAQQIDSLYEEATGNPCTCNTDENACRYCNAWDRARTKSAAVIRAALSRRPIAADEGTREEGIREAAAVACRYRLEAGGSQSYRAACHHIEQGIVALLDQQGER